MAHKKILIVDDDPDVRRGLQVRLRANHYETLFASDGISTIAEARKHHPDLIILDLGLPAGDGFAVMDLLMSNDALSVIPVIVVSGRDRFANKEKALQSGACAFFQKPVDNHSLITTIRKVLGQNRAMAESFIHDLGEI